MTDLNGTDPLQFIISANVHRRHLSQGQLAMVTAKILETKKYGEGGEAARKVGVSHARLSQARLVLRVTPTVVDRVLAGTLSLDPASPG